MLNSCMVPAPAADLHLCVLHMPDAGFLFSCDGSYYKPNLMPIYIHKLFVTELDKGICITNEHWMYTQDLSLHLG